MINVRIIAACDELDGKLVQLPACPTVGMIFAETVTDIEYRITRVKFISQADYVIVELEQLPTSAERHLELKFRTTRETWM